MQMTILLLSVFASPLVYPNYSYVKDSITLRGFVSQSFTKDQALSEFTKVSANTPSRFFNSSHRQDVLAFITPWNNQGYDISIEFGNKLSIVVPVWFTVTVKPEDGLVIGGTDAINSTWLEVITKRFPHILIAPRILIDLHPNVLQSNYKLVISKMREFFRNFTTVYPIHAFFIEFSSILPDTRTQSILKTLISDAKTLSTGKKTTIITNVLCPQRQPTHFDIIAPIKMMFDESDLVFVTVYELSRAAALSPITFIRDTIQWVSGFGKKASQKAIIGLPLFGFDYSLGGKDYVFGSDFLKIFSEGNPILKWMDKVEEHVLFFNKGGVSHTVYYPTPLFLEKRFETIARSDVDGVGFWELSHGLPAFFDLF